MAKKKIDRCSRCGGPREWGVSCPCPSYGLGLGEIDTLGPCPVCQCEVPRTPDAAYLGVPDPAAMGGKRQVPAHLDCVPGERDRRASYDGSGESGAERRRMEEGGTGYQPYVWGSR